jgi:hypothetical protein
LCTLAQVRRKRPATVNVSNFGREARLGNETQSSLIGIKEYEMLFIDHYNAGKDFGQ